MRRLLPAVAFLLTGCAAGERRSAPAEPVVQVKPAAFPNGKIEMATNEDPVRKPRGIVVAVLPLRNNTPDKNLDATGHSLADLIAADLAGRSGIDVVERDRINDLIDELARGDIGPVDAATAARYGKMLGANVMAFGSFGKVGAQYAVTMRLVKVETSEVVGGANEYLPDLDALGPRAQSLAGKLVAAISPAR